MTEWIKNDDGGEVKIDCCPLDDAVAVVMMQGAALVFRVNDEERDDVRMAFIYLSPDNLRELSAQALLVADALETRTA